MAGLDLENRPWYWGLIIGLVIAGGLVWAFENYLFTDIQKEIKARTGELQTLQQKVREGKLAENRLPQFREEAERLETELARLLRILPTARQTDELIKKIKSLTERGNFRLVSFQPQGFVKKEFYSEWPIVVQLQGAYHELALFFDRLSRFSRIINVDSLQIGAIQRKGPYTISSSFTMKTFIYTEPESGGRQEGAR
ncbi:MAG TPA: type 4a pilus biogenesis protein PilO [Thermoanaerobaculaceae bacterium]|nr:type 4a pilus biogenesis protein PilO [Thermoanaerobaculaceae bacterium]